jgi:putative ABC transport system ATP-binding protein
MFGAAEIVKLFQELAHQENKCVIVVTHDREVAEASDITIQLSKGNFAVSQKKEA